MRGTQAEALRSFWLELGITQKDISVPLATLYSHNTKVVDEGAPRLSFIRHPARFILDGEYDANVELPVHPNDETKGVRTWSIKDGAIWLESEDLEKMDVRLKEFADVALHDQEARVESIARQDQRPIIHWLPEHQSQEVLLTMTKQNELIHIQGRLEPHSYPPGTVVQLERIGYARIMDDGNLVLCHDDLQDE